MKIFLSNILTISNPPRILSREIRSRLSMGNPKFDEAVRMGRWTGNIPETLRYYRDEGDSIVTPRGFIRQLISMAKKEGVPFQVIDNRRTLPEVDFAFTGALKPFQEAALEDILSRDTGTLSSPTGSGKTVIALAAISERKQPALIIVHAKELFNQWIERIESFLGIPEKEIGRVGGGKFTIGDQVTVGVVNSVYSKADEIAPHVGHLVVDECHRTPSRTFTEAVSAFDCKYVLGLSATPWRRDKLSKLIFWHIADVVHQVDRDALIENGSILPVEVIERKTDFQTFLDPVEEYPKMLAELTRDRARNALICGDVAHEALNGSGVCLVLSDRKEHCGELQSILQNKFGIESELLTGDFSKTQREAVVQRLADGQVKVLVATGQLVGEGFDCRGLTTLFLATPIKFDGRLLQYIGRVMRPAPGKERALVYDYIDTRIGVLAAAARARKRVYGGGG